MLTTSFDILNMFLTSRVWGKAPRASTIVFGDTEISSGEVEGSSAFSALLVGHQEEHAACKIE